jgi:hypothetical protein
MEDEWTPQLTSLLDIPRRDLPMIWDADFMLGAPGADSYVLGEINVSSAFRFPTRRRQRSPAELPTGCGRSFECSESHLPSPLPSKSLNAATD